MREMITLESLCRALADEQIAAEELRGRALDTEARLTLLNCFIREGDAVSQFGEADQARKGTSLWGVPVSFKDNICVRGLPLTAGTRGMSGFIADQDAAIVSQLKALGAVVAGKNNMHELSFGVTSINPHWGAVGNPVAPGYCAGGSSGGSAAAVASGIVPLSVGTDTGGSIRIPAAFCGITGFRPTTGRWSTAGIIPVSHTKDCVGLLTRTAGDAEFVYGLLSGKQQSFPLSRTGPCRIGLPVSMWSDLDGEVERACVNALSLLRKTGFEFVEIDDADIVELNQTLTFTVPLYEFFADFAQSLLSLGWKHGIHHIFAQVDDANVKGIINHHLGEGAIKPAHYLSSLQNGELLKRKMDELFARHHIKLLGYPTVPCRVPHLDHADRPEFFSQAIRNTDLASNAMLPSITIPVGPEGRLPVGLSFDAPRARDAFLLSNVSLIEKVLKG
ncbi:amidase family protein [Pseudomonas syringae]|uniref:Amidase n=3 Tax=Pseudomonas TaxID=286 RepID=A0A3M5X5X2_9PSED|nr:MULTISPECIES: amidase family protein [Pseudomonas]MCW6054547.1 amidase [Pseudomonas fragi]MDF5776002.1 amidase family protein [Pseudomonas syringae pv. syringae]MDV0424614.1 amidase family protein [Pseudomonas sp. 17]MDX9570373.1 amidase family protein [Pseudomonas sp. 21(2023)]MDX9584166.1 amidase family protein [Pseudomonas sp. 19(2023)]